MKPPDEVARDLVDKHVDINGHVERYEYLQGDIAAAIREARSEAFERAARLCETERGLYVENGRACDASGNTFGGTADAISASTCSQLGDSIRKLAAEAREGKGRG